MAKVVVEYDTESKKLSVSLGGAAISDVDAVSFNRKMYEEDSDEFSMYICQCQDGGDGTTKFMQTMADGTLKPSVGPVQHDILKYFLKK